MQELNEFKAGVERLEENRAQITMIITPERFEEGMAHSYNVNKKKIEIPGFRKGKTPRKMIEAQYGKQFFYDEAINYVLPDAYEEALEESGLNVVSRPEVECPFADAEKGAVIVATLWTKPVGKIEGYKGLEYTPPSITVTDEEVEAVITGEQEKNARFVPVEERPVQNGDITRIDYEGSVDGVPFEGGKGEDQELIIGSGRFIPGFEEQLIGMNIGETRDINVSFPEEYHAEHLEGKPAVFVVTLHAIHHKELPEIDDEFAATVSDFETMSEYKADILAKLQKEKEENAESKKEEILGAILAERLEATIPDPMYETEIDHIVDGFARNMAGRGIRMEQYLQFMGGTIEGLRESYREIAIRNVRARLALEAIVAAEGFTATDCEIENEINTMAERYNMEPERLKEAMSPREFKGLGMDLCTQKALKLVIENAVEKEAEKENEIKAE